MLFERFWKMDDASRSYDTPVVEDCSDDKSVVTPSRPAARPAGQPRCGTERPNAVGERSTDASERSTDASERFTDASERFTDASERSTDASERPTDAGERSTDAGERPIFPDGRPNGPNKPPVYPRRRADGPDRRPISPHRCPARPPPAAHRLASWQIVHGSSGRLHGHQQSSPRAARRVKVSPPWQRAAPLPASVAPRRS